MQNLPELLTHAKPQTGSSEDTKQDKFKIESNTYMCLICYIILKLMNTKCKANNFKALREKRLITCRRITIIKTDYVRSYATRGHWNNIVKILKGKIPYELTILYLVKIIFIREQLIIISQAKKVLKILELIAWK